MRSYYPGIKLLSLDWIQQYVKSRPPCKFKTGHLKSLVRIEKRPQNTNHKLSDKYVIKIHHEINNKMLNTILLGFRDIFMGDTNFSN